MSPANANSGRRAYFHELIRSRLAAYALQDRGNLTFFLDAARKIASRVVREVEEAKGSVNRAAG